MKGKVCLITGGTSGIGKQTALSLAGAGATVVFTTREAEKGRNVRNEIVSLSENERVEALQCDLSSFDSIRGLARRFRDGYDRLDVLINNAGIWEKRRFLSEDSIERTFAVNHLAHFLLTNLLVDALIASSPARVISVSSGLHYGVIDFDDIEGERRYSAMRAYRQSKLANILFTKEIARRLAGTGVTANCLMPGFVRTELFRNTSALIRAFVTLLGKSPEKGARTAVYLATSPEVEGMSGICFRKCRPVRTSKASDDPEMARGLWEISERYLHDWLS